MDKIRIFTDKERPDTEMKEEIINFLFRHLEEYGDAKKDIERAVKYAMKEIDSFGGFILIAREEEDIIGAVVVNRTGMKGYIPENILVYIATHKDCRGKGVGRKLMKKAIDTAEGSLALHVEADNPARFLYEKVGFDTKYLEMRYIKSGE